LRQCNLTSHEEEEKYEDDPLSQIFYSQDRWIGNEKESHAGSTEICRAKMSLEVMKKGLVLLRPTSRDTPGEIFFFFGKFRK
jgi:hypothetical protein